MKYTMRKLFKSLMIHLFNEHTNAPDIIRVNHNSLIFSSLKKYYQPDKSEGFAVKYVVEGIERYELNGNDYPITNGKYLLTNETYKGSFERDAQKNVDGLCINLAPQLLTEVLAGKKRPDTAYADNELAKYFTSKNCQFSGQEVFILNTNTLRL